MGAQPHRVGRWRSGARVALLAACLAGSVAGAAEPVTLRLWNIPLKGSTSPVDMARRRVFEAFCQKYPDIRVEALVPLLIEGPAGEGREFMAVAGGVAPDVFYLYGRKIGDYHSQGFLQPLDPYLDAYAREHGEPYQGISAPSAVWELCPIDGHIRCVPVLYYSMALLCRQDLMARAGLEIRALRDWDELYRYARRLTWSPEREPGASLDDPPVVGLAVQTGPRAGWQMLQYFWSSGGEVVRSYYERPDGSGTNRTEVPAPPVDYRRYQIATSDADTYYPRLEQLRADLTARGIDPDYSMTDLKWRLAVNEPTGVKALEFYRRLIHQPWLRCTNAHPDREYDLAFDDLRAGRAACPVCGLAVDLTTREGKRRIYRGVCEGQTDAAGARQQRVLIAMTIGTLEEVAPSATDMGTLVPVPFPSRTADLPPAAFIAGHYLAINATQTDPRVRDAAWTYIAFMTGPEAQSIRVQTYIENGLSEFIRPDSLRALGYQLELDRIPPARRTLWAYLTSNPKVEPYCRGFQHVMIRQLSLPLEAVLNDEPDAEGRYSRDPQALLDAVCHDANTLKLDRPPPEVMARRQWIGWGMTVVVMLLLVVGIGYTIRFAVRLTRRAGDLEGFGIQSHAIGRTVMVVLFLTPAVGSVLLWGYYPLIRGTVMAFQDYKIIGGTKWVGLDNFVLTAGSPEFWRYLLQTLEYALMSLAMGFFAPLVLAILLTEIPRGTVLLRTIYYLPAITTGLVVMFLWKNLLYDPTDRGLINQFILSLNGRPPLTMALLKTLLTAIVAVVLVGLGRAAVSPGVSRLGRIIVLLIGAPLALFAVSSAVRILGGEGPVAWLTAPWDFQAQKFLQDPKLAMFWVIVPGIWAGVGPGCLIYLAALKSVPEEQYEAADLDGAGIWAKACRVLFPNLSALMTINFVGAVVGAMHASQQIFVMTGGGPEDATMTVGLNVWFNAFLFLNYGLATSQAWVLAALLIGFTLYQLRMMNRMQFRATGAKER
ncbi:MAG: extracellular solute-binding protein [Lentisphaerae bacterium]|nr:extracellular solute-binding protein [Lentisphaerota bacterium]